MYPNGYWKKWEYDENGNLTYCADYHGNFIKKKYDAQGNVIYYEDSEGVKRTYPINKK